MDTLRPAATHATVRPGHAPPGLLRRVLPGLALCLGAAGLAFALGEVVPGVSPLIVAIVLGVLLANVVRLPDTLAPGIDVAAKKLLRLGIVCLGLQVVLGDILGLGAAMLGVIVAIVAGGLLGTVLLGRLLRVPPGLALLVACGFSICGAAAVAGAAGVVDPDDRHEQDTITAVALVVLFGTAMIPLLPALAHLLGLDDRTAGLWAGGSIHEIAQVVAAGGVLGGGALSVAVVVKLARVLLLAPVVALLGVRQRWLRRRTRAAGDAECEEADEAAALPPVVPLFVIGFVALMLLRSFVALPPLVLSAGSAAETVLLAAAMFGLGCGVRIAALVRVGLRPFALAAAATTLVAAIALVGVRLAT